MRVLQAIMLAIGFAIGGAIGLLLAVIVVPVSLYRRARAVHAEGIVCRAVITALDPAVAQLAGPALVRLSGALAGPDAGSDILGLAIRMQRTASDDPRDGDQDLLLGTFESFATAGRDRARTIAGDFLANAYSSVTPWWLPGHGAVTLRIAPLPAQLATRAADRLARLDADLAADRARFTLAIGSAAVPHALAELRLTARLPLDDRPLHASMWRQGRGVRPLGVRNGIRATLYPLGQLARGLRGG